MGVGKTMERQDAEKMNLPRHIAFIMDGNGRWAQQRGLAREFGHKRGADAFRKLVKHCADIGIRYVTVYAFSTENWKRPQNEVTAIMNLLEDYLDVCLRDMKKNKIEVHFLGDVSPLSEKLKEKIKKAEEESRGYPYVLNLALNYGARDELVHAFRKLREKGITTVEEEDISAALYTAHCPDPDLIVRTGGEKRLSNFLLWQAAYAEFYFTDVLWPDFDRAEFDRAIESFSRRERRLGGRLDKK